MVRVFIFVQVGFLLEDYFSLELEKRNVEMEEIDDIDDCNKVIVRKWVY